MLDYLCTHLYTNNELALLYICFKHFYLKNIYKITSNIMLPVHYML